MSSKSGSSKRKPQVVRKVFDDSEGEENDENSNKDKEVNGDDVTVNGDDNMEVNGDTIPDELPEGTVVVEPEAVEDSNSSFKGPEFQSSKRKSDIGYLSIVTCTACGKQINTNQAGEARQHPDLKVLTCKSCYKFYKSGPITQDEDGLDEQCRWCSEGGKLFGCDFCNNTFCRSCIVRNLGRSELSVVQDEDSQWKCYMCNAKPLLGLVENCNKILEKIAKEKEKEKQKTLESGKKKSSSSDQSSNKNSKGKNDTPKTKPDTVDKKTESGNKSTGMEGAEKTEKPRPQTIKNILMEPKQQQSHTVNTQIQAKPQTQYVYVQAPARIDSQAIFGNNLTPRNIHLVIDKLLSVTSSLELLLSSIRVNIQNDQDSQDFMLSGIAFENRRSAVECVKSGVDLFLDELKQIDKTSPSYIPKTNTTVQTYSALENGGGNVPPNSSSLLAASLQGNPQSYRNIAPKPDPVVNLDVSKALAEVTKEVDDKKTEENSVEVKTDEKTETENNKAPETTDEMTNDTKEDDESSKEKEEKMEVDGDESTSKTVDKEEETKTEAKSDDESTEESDTSTSDDSDDESDEVSSGDFDDSWGGTKRRKTRQAKKKKDPSKKEKKKKKRKEKSKGKLNISFKFGSKKKNEEDSDDDSENEFEDKKKSKKSKEKSKGKSKRGSSSEDFDSDLENEIDKLSKDTSSKKKKKNAGKTSEDDGKKKKKETKKTDKDKKKGKKKTDKDDSSSDDDEGDKDNYDDETEEEKEEMGDLPFDQNDEETEEEENKDENVKAKEDLLKELNDSTTEDGSSDSEVIINSPKKKTTKKKVAKEAEKLTDDTDSDVVSSPKKKKTRSSLLEAKISDSDSDFQTPKKKRGKKRKASSTSEDKSESDSDSGSDKKKKKGKKGAKGKKGQQKRKRRRRIKKQSSSSDDEKENESDEEEGSEDESQTPGGMGKRKKIRKVKSDKKLTDATKEAVKAEEERRQRISDRQKQFNNIVQEVDENSPVKCPMTTQLVLEEDKETKKPIIEIDKCLIRQLKPHQVEAVQFVWDCTMETLERAKKEEGAGCILAHCMGLGKTLTLITFIHTMMVNEKKTKVRKALVVCPLNTVLNWQREFEMWQEHTKKEIEVFELSSVKQNFERAQVLQNWHDDGGVMIMGYEMFRILSTGSMCRSKKQKQIFAETLADPGPDLVVCDEGHILKNDASSISKAMSKIKTKRRVVLTGTPLQNNLIEYHCMVNFVKPNLLGTSKEFRNRFVNPISNGQCADSTMQDVKVMKRRAHILHEKLAGCVQRKDYSALTKFLPPKHEYVISVRLSKVQIDLYAKYLNLTLGDTVKVSGKGGRLFQDYQQLMRIWTHPWVLKMDEVIKERRAIFDDEFIDDSMSNSDSEGSASKESSSSDDEEEVIPLDSDSGTDKGRRTRSSRQARQKEKEEKESENSDTKEEPKREVFAGEVVKKWKTRSRGNEDLEEMIRKAEEEEQNRPLTKEWWAEFVSKEDFNKMELSGKLMLLFEILKMCEEIGDKILVFSQSLLSLDLIEDFLEIVDNKHQEETKDKTDEELADGQGFGKHWTKGEDYFRMDGSTGPQQRKDMASAFNDPENYRARLFLISTKAGSLGINLVGANRVIIFDASWNPSHDVQSIFRVYRFGQTKPVYVYRFLAQATMEEKIYERQIIKLSLSQRVVDEHQIERHFTSADLQELYMFNPDRLDDPDKKDRPTPVLPKDHMLAELFKSHQDWIVTYHEHDSLLENKIEEELSEEERKAAWEDYEREQKGITMSAQNFMGNMSK